MNIDTRKKAINSFIKDIRSGDAQSALKNLKEAVDLIDGERSDKLTKNIFETKEDMKERLIEQYEAKLKETLEKMDEDRSEKLQNVIDIIDEDHCNKLKEVLTKIDEDHTEKLQEVINKFNIEK